MIKLAISGCQGRMGMRIMHLAQEDKHFKLTALLEKNNHPALKGQVEKVPITADIKAIKNADVMIEFTTPEATLNHIVACRQYGVKMVIGTTGFDQEQQAVIQEASHEIPIVFASNMSVGVNILFCMVRDLAKKTNNLYNASIFEAHHIHKKDAPSGTAKTLGKIIQQVTGKEMPEIKSKREGEIIGDHTVTFESDMDTISISHHAKTRDIFAEGALVAAKFIQTKKSGLFTMEDVLALKK